MSNVSEQSSESMQAYVRQRNRIKQVCLDNCDGPIDPFVVLSRGLEAGARLRFASAALADGIERSLAWLGVAVSASGMELIKRSAARVTQGEANPEAEANALFDALRAAGVNVEDQGAYFEPGT
jgi:hypothetical protein